MKMQTTNAVIAAATDASKSIGAIREVFDDHFCRSFPTVFGDALRQSRAGAAVADETQGVLRRYLEEIKAGLEKAQYMLNEMTVELDVARGKAAGSTLPHTFKV